MNNPRENPTNTPEKNPSNTLLKNFRATLEARWNEFDTATMKEAKEQASVHPLGFMANIVERRDQDAEFQKAKQTFSEAQSMLATVSNDTDLKANVQILAKVEETLKGLTDYLASIKPEEKSKAHNIILAKTTADLAGFKAELTGKAEDKKSAEEATAIEQAIPRKAVAAAAVISGGIIGSAEAKTVIDEVKNEFKKELGPWGMIFQGVKGVSPKDVAEQVKAISKEFNEKKWMEDPVDKFFAMIKLFFLKGHIKNAGIDLGAHMSADELKLAGIEARSITKPPERLVEKDKYTPARMIFEGLLLEKNNNLPYTNILDNIQVKGTSMGELQKVHTSRKYGEYLKKIGLTIDENYQNGLQEILNTLFHGNKSKYVLEAYNSKKGIPKSSSLPQNEKFADYLITAGGVIKKMGGIAKATMSHKMPESPIKFNDETGEVAFSELEEGQETAKLFDGDRKLMTYMLGTNASLRVKMSDIDKPLGGSTLVSLYPDEIERKNAERTMKKIMNFGKSFMEGVVKNEDLHLGMNTELATIMNQREFSYKGYALIYMTLGGKDISNFSNLSSIEQAQIYGVIMTIFQTEESNYNKGRLTSRYLTALNKSTREIPKQVTKFFEDATMYAGEKGLGALAEGAKYLAGLAAENPKLAALFAALNIPWIPARNSVIDYF